MIFCDLIAEAGKDDCIRGAQENPLLLTFSRNCTCDVFLALGRSSALEKITYLKWKRGEVIGFYVL